MMHFLYAGRDREAMLNGTLWSLLRFPGSDAVGTKGPNTQYLNLNRHRGHPMPLLPVWKFHRKEGKKRVSGT